MENLGYLLACSPLILVVIAALLEINLNERAYSFIAGTIMLGIFLIWIF